MASAPPNLTLGAKMLRRLDPPHGSWRLAAMAPLAAAVETIKAEVDWSARA